MRETDSFVSMAAAPQACSNAAGESVLAIVATSGQGLELEGLLHIRAACHHLCSVITGHLPPGILYKAVSQPGRAQACLPRCHVPAAQSSALAETQSLQAEHLQLMRRLAGPNMTSMRVSPDYARFLHSLPYLQQVVLDLDAGMGICGSNALHKFVLQGADLASLASLHTLKVIGKGVDPDDHAIEQLELLTQLKELHLHSIFIVPCSGLHHAPILPQLTGMELHLESYMGYDSDYAESLLWLLENCDGHLKHLFLGAGYMDMMYSRPDRLCSLPCLRQLEHLELEFYGTHYVGLGSGIVLTFPSLLTLSVKFTTWAKGCCPIWDMSKCLSLHTLALTFADDPPRQITEAETDLQYEEHPTLDTTGLKGVHAAVLHVTLNFDPQARTIADFSDWNLDRVRVYASNAVSWRDVQEVRDLLGALLLGGVELDNITFNDEPVKLKLV